MERWKRLSAALLQESLQPVRKGHHRAGEAERGQWRRCSAQPKDWINPEAARAKDNTWQLISEAHPQLGQQCLLPTEEIQQNEFLFCADEIMSLRFRGAEKRYPEDTSK